MFFYFAKGYDSEHALREMTENADNGGATVHRSSTHSLYVFARDRISRYQIYSVESKKFGGPNQEVMIDFIKLHLKSKTGRNEEHVVLGFIEAESNRMRGYLVPNCKSQTIVQFLAKTVAKGSILYTPFYQETGWDFLDKYFEHRRLITMKGAHYDYESEKSSFHRRSGFDKVWRQVR